MRYKGYSAKVDFDHEDNIFSGRVLGLRDGINFHGRSVEELTAAFNQAVDGYLEACQALGQTPEKPYSGKISLRLPPEIHAAAVSAAEAEGDSLNHWIKEALEEKIRASG